MWSGGAGAVFSGYIFENLISFAITFGNHCHFTLVENKIYQIKQEIGLSFLLPVSVMAAMLFSCYSLPVLAVTEAKVQAQVNSAGRGVGAIKSFAGLRGGRHITGVEASKEHSEGIAFGMYHTGQYTAPQGAYETVQSVDGSSWYKQYAVDSV